MLNNEQIKEIAEIIGDDPDVISEMGLYWNPRRRGRFAHPTGEGVYTSEEVPLAPPGADTMGATVLGEVEYHFDVESHGSYRPATQIDPPEYPDVNLAGVRVFINAAFDSETGEELKPRSPEEAEAWKQAALRHWPMVADDALEQEQEKFGWQEPDYDD